MPEINNIIHEEMKIPSELLEHVAGRIIEKVSKNSLRLLQLK